MSRHQPTLREAIESVERIEYTIATAREVHPAPWTAERQATRFNSYEPVRADGFWCRHKSTRGWFDVRWPMSRIDMRCDDCGCVLRARRDAGSGFYYDARWLRGNPAERDPRLSSGYEGKSVCLPCFNRVRPLIARAKTVNDTRLMINRIQRELKNAA